MNETISLLSPVHYDKKNGHDDNLEPLTFTTTIAATFPLDLAC